jgi:hypothetical protein
MSLGELHSRYGRFGEETDSPLAPVGSGAKIPRLSSPSPTLFTHQATGSCGRNGSLCSKILHRHWLLDSEECYEKSCNDIRSSDRDLNSEPL